MKFVYFRARLAKFYLNKIYLWIKSKFHVLINNENWKRVFKLRWALFLVESYRMVRIKIGFLVDFKKSWYNLWLKNRKSHKIYDWNWLLTLTFIKIKILPHQIEPKLQFIVQSIQSKQSYMVLLRFDWIIRFIWMTTTEVLLYSSMNIGTSKGVVLTQRNFTATALMITSDQEVYRDPKNVFLCFLPSIHILIWRYVALYSVEEIWSFILKGDWIRITIFSSEIEPFSYI